MSVLDNIQRDIEEQRHRGHTKEVQELATRAGVAESCATDVCFISPATICTNKTGPLSVSHGNLASQVDICNATCDSQDKFACIKKINSERLRRNSLPESSVGNAPKENNLSSASCSRNVDSSANVQAHPDIEKAHSLCSDRAKVAPNITDVVKNVHGLFYSLKNVCKEKHIGEIINATHKNLTSAKNGYLNMKHEIFNEAKHTTTQKEILETLNKYTSLNLSSEEQDLVSYQYRRNSFAAVSDNTDETIKYDNIPIEEKPGQCLETNIESDSLHTSTLETIISEQNKQIDGLKNLLLFKDQANKDLQVKFSEICKQLESNVMRYATSEKQILSIEKARNIAVEKEAKAKEEVSILERRLKAAQAERVRICDMLDEKSREVFATQKEVNRLREELSSADTKLKWAQNKLLAEIEAHKDTSVLAEKLGQQVAQQEWATISSHKEGTSTTPQHSTLTEVQIKEIEAANILERHERQRLEEKCKELQRELELVTASFRSTTQEAEDLRARAESSAGEAAALRDVCNELRTQAAKDCERLAAAQARAARLDTVTGQLHQEQDKCVKVLSELEAEKKGRSCAQAEVELSTRREAELLRQTERLTEASVRLQATCSEAEAKALALSVDNTSLRAAAEREAERVALARSEAETEKRGREADARALAAAAARHQRAERSAIEKAEQLEGDLRVMATKHASTLKELKREIQQWKRKCGKLDTDSQVGSHNNAKIAERTGSCSSLSSFEGSTTQHCHEDGPVDKHQLVEKIVELQRAVARRSERLEFLEGHSAQLTVELQKKSRLLRALMASMPAGALAAPASDRAKVEIGKHGGIMASLFTNEVTDDTMSLELALEITAKLQGVLEDTLLKNITLKTSNIDVENPRVLQYADGYLGDAFHKAIDSIWAANESRPVMVDTI